MSVSFKFVRSFFLLLLCSLFYSHSVFSAPQEIVAKLIEVKNYSQETASSYELNRFPRSSEPSKLEQNNQKKEVAGEMISRSLVPGHIYLFTFETEDKEKIKVRYYRSWRWSPKPDFIVGAEMNLKLNKGRREVWIYPKGEKKIKGEWLI